MSWVVNDFGAGWVCQDERRGILHTRYCTLEEYGETVVYADVVRGGVYDPTSIPFSKGQDDYLF